MATFSLITYGEQTMKIVIGTINPAKITALQELLPNYSFLSSAELIAKAVPSGVSEQPLTLDETVQGARNRAQAAAEYGDIGIGIESGLFNIPGTQRYVDVSVCCIYKNDQWSYGFSSTFEIPACVLTYILNQKVDLGAAMKLSGLTNNDKLGAAEGAVGILTKGRVTRKDYTKQAITMALVNLDNPDLFTVS